MMKESSISPIPSDFEQIKKQNESGSEYWTSRDLCITLGYSTYQKFTRTINKSIGPFCNVENIHLTRMADLLGVDARTIN